ncbi:MAG: DegV family protein [Acholeplasmataceae bacterium]|nr:DegV family protein [Acholeplasmataceae bacterium]
MKDYVIVTDSCIDLPDKLAKSLALEVIPLSVWVEDRVYYNYLDEREITFQDFYKELQEKKRIQTSQLNPEAFMKNFEPLLRAGKDILSISFSSALSGTYASSLVAKEELLDKYKERKIVTIDSLCASMGQGLLLTYAAELKKEGKSLEEVASWVEENKLRVSHLFTVDDLNHLRRGGRLSTISALLGTILRVKPLLHVSKEGKLTVQDKARGRSSAINLLLERMLKTIVNPEEQIIYISHAEALSDAEYLREQIQKRLPVKEVLINYIGPVIGSHSGRGTLAVFYLGNDRINEK